MASSTPSWISLAGTAAAGFTFLRNELALDLQRGRRGGETAKRGAAMLARHHGGDLLRGLDDFIERDQRIEAGEGHVGAGKGVAGGHDVFTEAWSLDAIRDGIAN